MTLSMYQASVPVFVRALENLRHVLQKGEAFAADRGFDAGILLQTRLVPDMLPLLRQVQIAADMAARSAARLAGEEPRAFADAETTFGELYTRLDQAIEYIEGFGADRIDGSEGREIVLAMRSGERRYDGQSYLLQFTLPNLFFHATTAYDILRQAGVPLGKADFIGGSRN
jgi:hypothetical protein